MPIQTPTIDKRTYNEIVAKTKQLIAQYASCYAAQPVAEALIGQALAEDRAAVNGQTIFKQGDVVDQTTAEAICANAGDHPIKLQGWRSRMEDQPDVGEALVGIFAHMAVQVIERLNQAPERNFLAFLEMIGARQLPPRPARVPLTFYLAEGVQEKAVTVPVGTQAAPAADPNVIFETDDDLTVHRAQLKALFVHEPATDRYADRSSLLPMEASNSFPAFTVKELELIEHRVQHSLFLACDPFFALPEPKTVTLTLESQDAEQWRALPFVWSYAEDEAKPPLESKFAALSKGQFTLEFSNLPAPTMRKVDGIDAAWLHARLNKPMSRYVAIDRVWSNGATESAQHDLSKPYTAFSDNTMAMYMNLGDLAEFDPLSESLLVRLATQLAQPGKAGESLRLSWEVYRADQWQPLGESSIAEPPADAELVQDHTRALIQDGRVDLYIDNGWTKSNQFGILGYWLRVRLAQGSYAQRPQIKGIRITVQLRPIRINGISAKVTIAREEPVAKLIAFADTQRLDLSTEFYPFGEKPRRGAVFYLAIPVAFERGKNTVTLQFEPSVPATSEPPSDVRLVWEAWSHDRWQPTRFDDVTKLTEIAGKGAKTISVEQVDNLVASDYLLLDWGKENSEACQIDRVNGNKVELMRGLEKEHPKEASVSKIVTKDFTANDPVKLRLPDPTTKTVVNGESGYWLRARIDAGDYGKEADYKINKDGTIADYTPATFAPPVVKSLTLNYSYEASDLPVTWKTRNNFKFAGPKAAAQGNGESFAPFEPSAESDPALYLGFDKPLPNRTIALYWNVAPKVAGPTEFKPPTLEWQYACPGNERWKKLHLLSDETKNFTRRGLITFVGPADVEQRPEFDQNLYWLRVICKSNPLAAMPEVVRVLTNTVWASQARTMLNEILGSGTGEADQILAMTKAPVLEQPQIEVRELEMPNADDLKTIQQEEGADAIQRTEAGEIWVRWHEVADFYGSGPHSRHYRCDHLTGQVRFGDGRYGMTPPRGRNSVRATRYRTGGGKQGNQPAQTITQLKTTIPFVNRVTNHEAAEGGADQEPFDGVKERGPKLLRHRDRAVTLADFEDLAYEASPAVARAYAISEGIGNVTLVIVARREAAKPAPTLALCEDVAAYLRQRCAPAAQLLVCAPDWVEVTVTVAVVPTTAQAANTLVATVRSALQRFLHPLTGGLDQQGWTFGRRPYASDLYAQIEALEGVDYVSKLEMTLRTEDDSGKLEMTTLSKDAELSPRSMIFSGAHIVTVE